MGNYKSTIEGGDPSHAKICRVSGPAMRGEKAVVKEQQSKLSKEKSERRECCR